MANYPCHFAQYTPVHSMQCAPLHIAPRTSSINALGSSCSHHSEMQTCLGSSIKPSMLQYCHDEICVGLQP